MNLLDLGMLVRDTRKRKKLTQAEVVKRSGVSRARLDALENGRVTDIKIRNVISILNAVGLDLKVVDATPRRPTLEDLMQEDEEEDYAPCMGR